jgi:hypothetical protein
MPHRRRQQLFITRFMTDVKPRAISETMGRTRSSRLLMAPYCARQAEEETASTREAANRLYHDTLRFDPQDFAAARSAFRFASRLDGHSFSLLLEDRGSEVASFAGQGAA